MALPGLAHSADPADHRDLEFARVGEKKLLLDLFVPAREAGAPPAPLIVWVHGGAWRSGSKSENPLLPLRSRGFAVSSIEYRLSGEAPFPAAMHDIKAAIRFLRAKAETYGLDVNRVAIGGSSAGGHLAALAGVSAGVAALEGEVGDHRDQSTAIQAIIDWYGPTNFMSILDQSTPHGLSVRVPAFDQFLGGQPKDKPDLARMASPVVHVDAQDPPLFIFHGDQDPQVPINQSHELVGRYEALGLPVKFTVLHGAAHGGAAFSRPERIEECRKFLVEALKIEAKIDAANSNAPEVFRCSFNGRLFRESGVDDDGVLVHAQMPATTIWVLGKIEKVSITPTSLSIVREDDSALFALVENKWRRTSLQLAFDSNSLTGRLDPSFVVGKWASIGFTEEGQLVDVICPVLAPRK